MTDYLTDSGDTYCFGRCGRHLIQPEERRHAREVAEDELAVYMVHDHDRCSRAPESAMSPPRGSTPSTEPIRRCQAHAYKTTGAYVQVMDLIEYLAYLVHDS